MKKTVSKDTSVYNTELNKKLNCMYEQLIGTDNMQYCDTEMKVLLGQVVGSMNSLQDDLKLKISYPEARNQIIFKFTAILKSWEDVIERLYFKKSTNKKNDPSFFKQPDTKSVYLTEEVFNALKTAGYNLQEIAFMANVSRNKLYLWQKSGFKND